MAIVFMKNVPQTLSQFAIFRKMLLDFQGCIACNVPKNVIKLPRLYRLHFLVNVNFPAVEPFLSWQLHVQS